MSWFRWHDGDLILQVKIQPGASRSEFVGLHGEHLKLRIHAPAVDGRANAELLAFLHESLATPRANINIERGEQGPVKCIRIQAPRSLPEALLQLGLTAI